MCCAVLERIAVVGGLMPDTTHDQGTQIQYVEVIEGQAKGDLNGRWRLPSSEFPKDARRRTQRRHSKGRGYVCTYTAKAQAKYAATAQATQQRHRWQGYGSMDKAIK